LRKPLVFVGGHIGFFLPRAGTGSEPGCEARKDCDIYDMITRELTLSRGDFRSVAFGGDLGIPIGSHFAAVIGLEYSRSTTNSESRDYVEDNGDPIAQTTRMSQTPLTVTLRYYPRNMGESVGSYAWMPTRLNPYIGGGVGILHFAFAQYGRFVDKNSLSIFSEEFKSSGFTATEHLAGGMDVSLTPRMFVNGEARYSWANAKLSNDFTGFKPMDLAGFRLLGGLYFRF
jgi:opacity protein-like surface antigen